MICSNASEEPAASIFSVKM